MSHDRSPPPYPSQSTGIFLTTNKTMLNQHKESEKHLETIDAIGRGGVVDDDVGDEKATNNRIDLQYSENPDRPVLQNCLENQFLTHIGFACNYLYPHSQNIQQSLPKKSPDLLTQFPPRSLHHHQSTDLHHHHHHHHQEQQLMHYQQLQHQQQHPCQPETQHCRHQPHSPDEHFVDGPQSAQRHSAHYQPQRQIKYLSNHNSFEGRPWSSVCFRPTQRNFSLPNSPLLSQRHQLRQSHLHQQPNYQQEALHRRLMQQYSQQEQQRLLANCDPVYYDLCLHDRPNDCQPVPLAVQHASHQTQHLAQLPQHPNPLRETTSHLQSRLQQLQSPMDLYLTGNMTDHSVTSEQPIQRPQSAFPHLDIAKHSQVLRQPLEESFDNVNDDDQQNSYDHHLYFYLRHQADNSNNNTLASLKDNAQAGADHNIATRSNQSTTEHRTDLVFEPKVQQQCLQSESNLAEVIDSRGTGDEKVLKQLPLSSLKISPDSMIGQLLASSKQLTLQQKPPLAQSQQPQNLQTKQHQPTKQAIQQQQTKQQQQQQQQQQQNKVIKDPASTQQTAQKSQQPHSAKPVLSTTPRPSFLATSQSSTQSFMQSGKKAGERRGSKGSPTSATAPCTPTSTNQPSFPKRNSPPKTSMTASSSNGSLADSPVSVSNAFNKSNLQKSITNSKVLSARKGNAPPVIPGSATLIRGVVNPAGHKQATSKVTAVNNVKSSIANSQLLSASKKGSSPPMPKNQVIRKSSAPNPYGSVNGASLSRTRHSSASSNGNSNGGHGPYPITRSTYPASHPTNLYSNGANAIRLNSNLVSKSTLVDSQHSLFSSPIDTTSSYKIVQTLSYPSKLGILTKTVPDDSGKNESMADHFIEEADGLDEQVKDSLVPTNSLLHGTADHQSHYQHFPLTQHPQQSIQLKQHQLDAQQQRLLKQMSHQLLQQSLQQHESDYLRFTQQQQQLMLQQQQQQQQAQHYHSLQQCSNLASARNCLEALQTPDAITSPIMTSTPKTRICESSTHPEVDSVSRASEVVEQLSDENRVLRKELESYYKKISTLEKVEREIERMGRAYESLVNQTERRENLERIVRLKLESEVIRLNEDNKDFKDQLQQCLSQLESLNESLTPGSTPMTSPTQSLASSSVELQQKKELQRKDAMLMKLLKQNHTLLSAKNELEFEASVLRRTLEEQKKQMAILKLSLAQAQAASNKYFIELENFRSREASVIQVYPQHPSTSNSNENNNIGHVSNNDNNNNNYFDSYFINGIQYDNRFIGNLRPPLSGEKRLIKDECDTDDGISSDSSSINNSGSWVKVAEIRKLLQNWEQKYSMGLKARQQERIRSVFGGPLSMPPLLQSIVPKTCRDGLLPKRSHGLKCLIISEDHCGFHCVCGSCKHVPYNMEVPHKDERFAFDQGGIRSDHQRPITCALERGNPYFDNPISPSDQTMIIHGDDDAYDDIRVDDESDDDDDLQF